MREPETDRTLRSAAWFGAGGKNGFVARHHMRQIGLDRAALSRPVIGICDTFSETTPCNAHLRTLTEHVRRGVQAAGGTALEFPVMSLGEPLLRPTSMLFRNQMAMDVEESIRANPFDAVVLLGGCDKTTPALVMGATSADLPAILLTGGPMLDGRFRGRAVGSGTDVWRMTEDLRAGKIGESDFAEFESCLARSAGHCMTMGTASTMACLTEVMGLQLPGAATLPAVDARRAVLAEKTGRRAVELVREQIRPSDVLTRDAFENAIVLLAAIGGSTNAVLHLLAMAGRAGVTLDLDDFDRLGRDVPLLVDLMPSGQYLMEEFDDAGGVAAVVAALGDRLHRAAQTVGGVTLGDAYEDVHLTPNPVVRGLDDPVQPVGSATAVLRGSLAPDGAVIKQSAASPALLRHRGPARVFDSLEDYVAVEDDPTSGITADTVLVIRNLGPQGYPGMPEAANVPLPQHLLAAGVTDIVRVCDGRMSGTAYGTVVLHVAPESYVGGPLALVRDGDMIVLDVPARRLDLEVPDDEMARRRARWSPPSRAGERGWVKLYRDHVMQADRGVDLDVLVGASGSEPPRQAF